MTYVSVFSFLSLIIVSFSFITSFSFFQSVSKYDNKSSKFLLLNSSSVKFSFIFVVNSLDISKNVLIQQILQISSISGLVNSLILVKAS